MKRFFKKLFRTKKGFTLLEVVLAFTLMMVCAQTILPAYTQAMGYVSRARELRNLSGAASLKIATDDYDVGTNPVYIITTTVEINYDDVQKASTTQEFNTSTADTGLGDDDVLQLVVKYEDWQFSVKKK